MKQGVELENPESINDTNAVYHFMDHSFNCFFSILTIFASFIRNSGNTLHPTF